MEERRKEDASRQPSLKLTKAPPPPPSPRTKWTRRVPHPVLIGHAASLSQAVEETEYELAQKVTGMEDPRTTVPCEPAGLSMGDRRQKKKGKDGEKLHKAAVPEAYMVFGNEGESQRLAPSVVTLEKPGATVEAEAVKGAGKGEGDLIDGSAPDVLTMKFDVSFVDEKARMAFADKQRHKLAQLLRIPVEEIHVRMAVPGSPITVVTFEITPNVVRRAREDEEVTADSRPFDNPVLDVAVMATADETAKAIMGRMKTICGPKVPINRASLVPGMAGTPMKDRNVKFSGGADEPVPPPPPRTKWTRRVPHPVLIGHAAFLPRTNRTRRAPCRSRPTSSRARSWRTARSATRARS